MVELDVEYDCDVGRKFEEIAAVLARFGDEQSARARASPAPYRAADVYGGLVTAQRVCGHARHSGLAVRARHGDERTDARAYAAERLRARKHRNAESARLGEFGIVLSHRRRVYDQIGAAHERRVVSAQRYVRAGDLAAAEAQNFGYPPHAHAAYSYEMNAHNILFMRPPPQGCAEPRENPGKANRSGICEN